MDLNFLIIPWMNLSSYGLVILIQRVVEPIHFRLNLSTYMDLMIF